MSVPGSETIVKSCIDSSLKSIEADVRGSMEAHQPHNWLNVIGTRQSCVASFIGRYRKHSP
jgi:hypothetical protein